MVTTVRFWPPSPPTEPRNVTKEAHLLLEVAEAIRMICDALEDALEPNGRSLVMDAEKRLHRAIVQFKAEGGAE